MSSFHIGKLQVKEDRKEELLASFGMLKEMPGFLNNTVYVSDTDSKSLTTVEEWESKQHHDDFMAGLSEEALAAWMSMLEQPPVSQFFTKL